MPDVIEQPPEHVPTSGILASYRGVVAYGSIAMSHDELDILSRLLLRSKSMNWQTRCIAARRSHVTKGSHRFRLGRLGHRGARSRRDMAATRCLHGHTPSQIRRVHTMTATFDRHIFTARCVLPVWPVRPVRKSKYLPNLFISAVETPSTRRSGIEWADHMTFARCWACLSRLVGNDLIPTLHILPRRPQIAVPQVLNRAWRD